VVRPDGTSFMSPDMQEITMKVGVDYVNKAVGIDVTGERMIEVLKKMQMPATMNKKKAELTVQIPCTRSDVLHKCDIMEDIAIAYGFNNIKRTVPPVHTTGKQQPINHLTDLLRNEMAQAGYTEILTFGLCSKKEQYDYMGLENDKQGVSIGNPKGEDFEMVRISLIPGLLKTLNSSKANAPPWRLFESSDILFLDPSVDVGARNERRLAAVYSGATSGFELIHGLVDRIMLLNRKDHAAGDYKLVSADKAEEAKYPFYFPGRCAKIMLHGEQIGTLGILHPKTLAKFGLTNYPVSAMELNAEKFL